MDPAIIAAIIGAIGALFAATVPFIVRGRLTAPVSTPSEATSLADAADMERALRSDPRIQRLLSNPNWGSTAEAAIDNLFRNIASPVKDWPATATWQQVETIFKEQTRA